MNPKKKRTDITSDAVNEMFQQGKTVIEMADHFECSTGLIYRVLRRYDTFSMRDDRDRLRRELHIAMEALNTIVEWNNPERTRRALLKAAIQLRNAK